MAGSSEGVAGRIVIVRGVLWRNGEAGSKKARRHLRVCKYLGMRTNAHELSKSAGGPEDRVEVEEHVVRGCEALSWPGTDEANYLSYAHTHARNELNRRTYVFYYL